MTPPRIHGVIPRRLSRLDWGGVEERLHAGGWAHLPRILADAECRALVALYDRDDRFRSTVDMDRHRFGRGRYRYFCRPLPVVVETLRRELYVRLQGVANEWAAQLGREPYPPTLAGFLRTCRAAGQTRPTPLLLRYGEGDYNCLHQDVYGSVGFPLQVLILLSQRGRDYDGGEVILTEQRPRQQSRAVALAPARGDAVVFTNRDRPVRGTRGFYAAQMRHGTSPLTRGRRFVLGIIFHDAR